MAFARAIVDRPLKADVLAASEKIENAERRRGIWRIEHEGANHAPRTGEAEPISLRLVLEDFQTQANGTRQNEVGGNAIGRGYGKDPGKSAVRRFKDNKDNKPDAEDPQSNDQQTLRKTYE